MKFEVRACTPEEYAKANMIPGYAPQEYVLTTLEAATENQARRILTKGIKQGKYPSGSALVEVPRNQNNIERFQ